jgi:hypothetical protein
MPVSVGAGRSNDTLRKKGSRKVREPHLSLNGTSAAADPGKKTEKPQFGLEDSSLQSSARQERLTRRRFRWAWGADCRVSTTCTVYGVCSPNRCNHVTVKSVEDRQILYLQPGWRPPIPLDGGTAIRYQPAIILQVLASAAGDLAELPEPGNRVWTDPIAIIGASGKMHR